MKCLRAAAHFGVGLHETGTSILQGIFIINFRELSLKYRHSLPIHLLHSLQLVFARVSIDESVLSQQLSIPNETISTLTSSNYFPSK